MKENRPQILSGKGHYEKCKELLQDGPVEIYKNLKKGLWSVRQNGRVVFHTDYICLKQCSFVVCKKGRLRVLREKRKNVHAFVRGFLCDPNEPPFVVDYNWNPVNYDPYTADSFMSYGNPVYSADYVDMMIGSESTPVLAFGEKC